MSTAKGESVCSAKLSPAFARARRRAARLCVLAAALAHEALLAVVAHPAVAEGREDLAQVLLAARDEGEEPGGVREAAAARAPPHLEGQALEAIRAHRDAPQVR